MDEAKESQDAEIIIESPPLHAMAPALAKGLVVAQSKATTVENDGKNPHQNYSYATQAAIACRARESLAAGGLALLPQGWGHRDGRVFSSFVLIHESGAMSPEYKGSMPVGRNTDPAKAVAGALSILRKYMSACLLNMGWSDPSEDIDSGLMEQRGRNRGRNRGRQDAAQRRSHNEQEWHDEPRETQRSTPQPSPAVDEPPDVPVHSNPVYNTMLQVAVAVFSKSNMGQENIWRCATGLDRMPSKTEPDSCPPHALKAVEVFHRNLTNKDLPKFAGTLSHQSYIAYCNEHSLSVPMSEGKPTDIGLAVDAGVAKSETGGGEGE